MGLFLFADTLYIDFAIDKYNILCYHHTVIDSMCVLRRNAELGFPPGGEGIYLALHTLLPLYGMSAGLLRPFGV